jgi:hypothetical protein
MEKHRLAKAACQFKLILKAFPLGVLRGEITVVIKAALSDSPDFAVIQGKKLPEPGKRTFVPVFGVMGMNSG